MELIQLRQLIVDAFAEAPKPHHDEIAPHRCDECDELAADLAQFLAAEIPDDVFQKHVWDLPLLSADAKKYYLQAWLLRCVVTTSHWLPDEATTVLIALEGQHRWDSTQPFTRKQWQAIYAWLDYVAQFASELDIESLEKACARVQFELEHCGP